MPSAAPARSARVGWQLPSFGLQRIIVPRVVEEWQSTIWTVSTGSLGRGVAPVRLASGAGASDRETGELSMQDSLIAISIVAYATFARRVSRARQDTPNTHTLD